MRYKVILILMICSLFCSKSYSAGKDVLAHYLSWFQSKDDKVNSVWGQTWSMNFHTPDGYKDYVKMLRDISAVDYPLIGPYDSDDSKTLEYHVLLAQASGIHGFVVDWFGTNKDNSTSKDGFENLALTVNKLNQMNTAGFYSNFKLCISYDEQALDEYPGDYTTYASNEIDYIKNNYANNIYYYTNRDTNKPLLFIWEYFSYISNKNKWETLLNKFTNFFAVDFREYPDDCTFQSHFPWVQGFQADGSGFGEAYIDDFYYKSGTNSSLKFTTGGVWPGFDESGWKSDNLRLMKRNGLSVYQNTWNKIDNYSGANPMSIVQIITWNDWGEGTEIEPSVEYGYKYITETRNQINILLSANLTNDHALLVPQYIYNARLAVDQGINGSSAVRITNAITDFYSRRYYSALTNTVKAMNTEIPQILYIDRYNKEIRLRWNKTTNSTGYKIYVGTSSNYLKLINEFWCSNISDANITNITVKAIDNSQDYFCCISSVIGEKNNESRYKIESFPSIMVRSKGDLKSPQGLVNFKAEKINNRIKLSWRTPTDPDYYSSCICFMSSSRYPATPDEGIEIVHITNTQGVDAEYYYDNKTGGYKYFSGFAMDKMRNYSQPSYARVTIIDKPIKLAGNFINPGKGNEQVKIYIDTVEANKKVKINIYNLKGKLVKSFGERVLSAGRNQFFWPESTGELDGISSGVYILSITGDIEQKEKIVVVK